MYKLLTYNNFKIILIIIMFNSSSINIVLRKKPFENSKKLYFLEIMNHLTNDGQLKFQLRSSNEH